MKKIRFIIPYFGKFNSYFQLFLNSCETNKDMCDWIIFTDDDTVYNYPSNVEIKYITFEETKHFFQSKFDFDISLNNPYKLCDYRPAYGYVYADYLTGYEFWGECDLDLVWGKFSHFLSNELLDGYDKIFNLGHCTIYRNTPEISKAFMLPVKGKIRYKEVFSCKTNCSFDEEYHDSINNIFLDHGISVFENSFAANTYMKTSGFKLTKLDLDKMTYITEKKSQNFFVWNNGVLERYKKNAGSCIRKEYLYIHFQSRKMKNKIIKNTQIYKIIPNSFNNLEIPIEKIDGNTFSRIRKKEWNFHYFRLRTKNLYLKIFKSRFGQK